MTYHEIVRTVGNGYSDAITLVETIRRKLHGAEYENIKARRPGSVPSVYLSYNGQRPLSFDLRRGGGVKVFFWKPKRLSTEIEIKFNIIPERRTGWKGFLIKSLHDSTFEKALSAILSYWMDCARAIDSGEEKTRWKREDLIKTMVRRAFREETPVFNRQSIPRCAAKPDIFIPSLRVIIQVDGAQHYRRVPLFHPTQKAFKEQVRRDGRSDSAALAAGFSVLRVVTDAADLLTQRSLRRYVVAIAGQVRVLYLVRSGNRLALTDKKPILY